MAESRPSCLSDDDSDADSTDSARNQRYNDVINTVAYIKNLKGFEILGELGEGSYGNVLLIYDNKSRSHKAMKIVGSEKSSKLESILWPMLRHENVLPTEAPIRMGDETIIFLSPIKVKGLDKIAGKKNFSNYPYCVQVLTLWLKEILCGLRYLHSYSYCHLDLKTDNVLIGSDGTACIADFTFINFNQNLLSVRDIGLPPIYCPPEVFTEELSSDIRGNSLDNWAFGMIVCEVFTRDYILRHVSPRCGWDDIRLTLQHILETEAFKKRFNKVFPHNNFNQQRFTLLLQFIRLFLHENIHMRASSTMALKHPFFNWTGTFRITMHEIFPYINTLMEGEISASDKEDMEEAELAFKRRQTRTTLMEPTLRSRITTAPLNYRETTFHNVETANEPRKTTNEPKETTSIASSEKTASIASSEPTTANAPSEPTTANAPSEPTTANAFMRTTAEYAPRETTTANAYSGTTTANAYSGTTANAYSGTTAEYAPRETTVSAYSGTAAVSAYSEKTTPSAYSEKTTPSAYSEKTTPSAYSEKTTPSAYSEKTTPSAYSRTTAEYAPRETTASAYSGTAAVSAYSEKTTPSAYSEKTTPSAYSRTTTPSAYSKTTTPSAYSRTSSAYSEKTTPSAYSRASSAYSEKTTPSAYSRASSAYSEKTTSAYSRITSESAASETTTKETRKKRSKKTTSKNRSTKGSKKSSGKRKSGKTKSGKRKSGKTRSGKRKSGKTRSGKARSGKTRSGKTRSGKTKSGKKKSGKRRRSANSGSSSSSRGSAVESRVTTARTRN